MVAFTSKNECTNFRDERLKCKAVVDLSADDRMNLIALNIMKRLDREKVAQIGVRVWSSPRTSGCPPTFCMQIRCLMKKLSITVREIASPQIIILLHSFIMLSLFRMRSHSPFAFNQSGTAKCANFRPNGKRPKSSYKFVLISIQINKDVLPKAKRLRRSG